MPFIDEDFVAVWKKMDNKGAGRRVTLVFGDEVEIVAVHAGWVEVLYPTYFDGNGEPGFIEGTPALRDDGIVKFSMVDVQQGDGMVLETPSGKIVFIDGGDNKLFARHVAARFRHRDSSAENPLEIDGIIVTHGDADHFDGLNDIRRSEKLTGDRKRKRLFIKPKRIFGNGLVKAKSTTPNLEKFGATTVVDGTTYILDLFDDPRDADETAMNREFKWWKTSLDHWEKNGHNIEFVRVRHGMGGDPFQFLEDDGIGVEIQGPFTDTITHNGQQVEALPFLRAPKQAPELALEDPDENAGSESASHTINGHSIALRLTYGNVRFSLSGDMNQDAMRRMFQRLSAPQLEAEVLKAPHHGSHDFDVAVLKAVKPTVALVSSGDENSFKEHIHPRATLMAALGQVMPGLGGVVLSTELAAFFHTRDMSSKRSDLHKFFKDHDKKQWKKDDLLDLFAGDPDDGDPASFFAFERTNFGIIHIRTDGERLLVFTHSGKQGLNEAYRLRVLQDSAGARVVTFEPVVTR